LLCVGLHSNRTGFYDIDPLICFLLLTNSLVLFRKKNIMQKTFIVVLVLIFAIVLFALDNSAMVDISFWFWSVRSNLSLVIIFSIIVGAFMSSLFSLSYWFKKKQEVKEIEKEVNDKDKKIKLLEDEIRILKADKPRPFAEFKEL